MTKRSRLANLIIEEIMVERSMLENKLDVKFIVQENIFFSTLKKQRWNPTESMDIFNNLLGC